MKKTVLLTGSRGFTGKYVREALEREGFSVVGLVQSDAHADEVDADLLDVDGLRRAVAQVQPNYVIHLAAIAFVAHSRPDAFYQVNLFGTLNLLEVLYAERVPVEKVLLSSSANVYGNPPVSQVSEDVMPAPVNHYAMSKLAMEHMARTWVDRLPILFTRPFNYTGVGQEGQFLIPKIVDHFARRASVIQLGNIDVEREFNDVRMIAQAYSGLMQKADAGEVFNLCSGQGYQLKEVMRMCEDITGHTMSIEVSPALVRENELKVLIGDASKLNKQLPDLPKYQLKETLAWMLGLK
jgi:nucleoside-diphosphate-sugar epimerase